MNARKVTIQHLGKEISVSAESIARLLARRAVAVDAQAAENIAATLSIELSQLVLSHQLDRMVELQGPDALMATRRTISRGGFPFYNYYSMASPPGRIAPQILDILCPRGELPILNNGHLEPAITVNLGPGDIYGRWGERITPDTFCVLHANHGSDPWICGDSYIEPPYRPHAYSLVDSTSARIVSYTGKANLASLIEETNNWSDEIHSEFIDWLERGVDSAGLIDSLLARRGYDRESAEAQAGLPPNTLDQILSDPFSHIASLRLLANYLGLDYRLLLPVNQRYDATGKSVMTIGESRFTIRNFRSYTVASTACSPHVPDMTGLFFKVSEGQGVAGGSLVEIADTHYFVIEGIPVLEWIDQSGQVIASPLRVDSSAWVGPFVRHRWAGNGAMLKLSSGNHLGYQDLFEITNTYSPWQTLNRARRDLLNWGYET